MAQTAQFTVTGENPIHCENCEQRIGNALRRLPGVEQVEASHQTQQVTVVFDPAHVDAEQVRAKLEQAGFAATPSGGGA